MEVEEDGRLARYAGASKSGHDEAAAIRADFPMPRQCGIYYYEITVISKGKDGYVPFMRRMCADSTRRTATTKTLV